MYIQLLLAVLSLSQLDPPECGGVYNLDTTATSGTVRYPFSGQYENNVGSYCWRIKSTKWIHLTWKTVDIEDYAECARVLPCGYGSCPYLFQQHTCDNDALIMFDSSGDAGMEICGMNAQNILWQPSVAGDIVFRFRSDGDTVGLGFNVQFSTCDVKPDTGFAVKKAPRCQSQINNVTTDLTGTLKYPETGNYDGAVSTCWRILCNGQLTLTWKKVDLDTSGIGCNHDRITIYDTEEIGHTLCSVPIDPMVYPPGELVIHFGSDVCAHKSGFEVDWSCGAWNYPSPPQKGSLIASDCNIYTKDFSDSTGYLAHPDTLNTQYGPNEHFCWRIQCGGQLTLTFHELEIENVSGSSPYCSDHLMFEQDMLVRSEYICGEVGILPDYQPPKRGDLGIHFVSDTNSNLGGFNFSWVCDNSPDPPAPSDPGMQPQATLPPPVTCYVPTNAPPTDAPTAVPMTATPTTAPDTMPPDTAMPPGSTLSPATPSPDTSAPSTSAPLTQAPPTSEPGAAPTTPRPDTPTFVPVTVAPPTTGPTAVPTRSPGIVPTPAPPTETTETLNKTGIEEVLTSTGKTVIRTTDGGVTVVDKTEGGGGGGGFGGSVTVPGGPQTAVKVSGKTLVMGSANGTVSIVDIEKTPPTVKGSWTATGEVRSIAIGRSLLAVSDSAGLKIVSLRNPELPILMGELKVGYMQEMGFTEDATFLFGVPEGSGEVLMFDVRDPTRPSLKYSLEVKIPVSSVRVGRDEVFVCDSEGLKRFNTGTLPPSLALSQPGACGLLAATHERRYLFVSDPVTGGAANAKRITQYSLDPSLTADGLLFSRGPVLSMEVSADDRYLYVADSLGLQVFPLVRTNPGRLDNPLLKLEGTVRTGTKANGMKVLDKSQMVIAADDEGLSSFFNIFDSKNSDGRKKWITGGATAVETSLDGRWGFYGKGSAVTVFEVVTLNTVTTVATPSEVRSMALYANILYVTCIDGVYSYSLNDLPQVSFLSTVLTNTVDAVSSSSVNRTLWYVADGRAGVKVYNTTISTTQPIIATNTVGEIRKVVPFKQYLLAADGVDGLKLYKVDTESRVAELLARLETSEAIYDIVLEPETMKGYIAEGRRGVSSFNCGTLDKITVTSTVDLVDSVFLSLTEYSGSGYILAGDRTGLLSVIELIKEVPMYLESPWPEYAVGVGFETKLTPKEVASREATSVEVRSVVRIASGREAAWPEWLEYSDPLLLRGTPPKELTGQEVVLKFAVELPNGAVHEVFYTLSIVPSLKVRNELGKPQVVTPANTGVATLQLEAPRSGEFLPEQGAVSVTSKPVEGSLRVYGPVPDLNDFLKGLRFDLKEPSENLSRVTLLVTDDVNQGAVQYNITVADLKFNMRPVFEGNKNNTNNNNNWDPTATTGQGFRFQLVPIRVSDPDGDALTLSAVEVGRQSLPGWLELDPSGYFYGEATVEDVGTVEINLTARDTYGGETSRVFKLRVKRSFWDLFWYVFSIVAPIVSGLGMLYGAWVYYSLLWNNFGGRWYYWEVPPSLLLTGEWYHAERKKKKKESRRIDPESVREIRMMRHIKHSLGQKVRSRLRWVLPSAYLRHERQEPLVNGDNLTPWIEYNELAHTFRLLYDEIDDDDAGIYYLIVFGRFDDILQEIRLEPAVVKSQEHRLRTAEKASVSFKDLLEEAEVETPLSPNPLGYRKMSCSLNPEAQSEADVLLL